MNQPGAPEAIVVIGDVVGSRTDFRGSGAALERLTSALDDRYRGATLARFEFTQGDELQGLLVPTADPFPAVLLPALDDRPLRMRWAIVRGPVEPGRGPATRRSGPGFVAARAAIRDAARMRVGLVVRCGDPERDALFRDLAPLLPVLLQDLSARQREIGRLMLLDDLRQADVAERLGITRASVSVAHRRARLAGIAGLVRALRALLGAAPERSGSSQVGNETAVTDGPALPGASVMR